MENKESIQKVDLLHFEIASNLLPGQIYCVRHPSTFLIVLAGLPATSVYGGSSFVTTDPAAITAPSPTVMPFSKMDRHLIQTLSPINTGLMAY